MVPSPSPSELNKLPESLQGLQGQAKIYLGNVSPWQPSPVKARKGKKSIKYLKYWRPDCLLTQPITCNFTGINGLGTHLAGSRLLFLFRAYLCGLGKTTLSKWVSFVCTTKAFFGKAATLEFEDKTPAPVDVSPYVATTYVDLR